MTISKSLTLSVSQVSNAVTGLLPLQAVMRCERPVRVWPVVCTCSFLAGTCGCQPPLSGGTPVPSWGSLVGVGIRQLCTHATQPALCGCSFSLRLCPPVPTEVMRSGRPRPPARPRLHACSLSSPRVGHGELGAETWAVCTVPPGDTSSIALPFHGGETEAGVITSHSFVVSEVGFQLGKPGPLAAEYLCFCHTVVRKQLLVTSPRALGFRGPASSLGHPRVPIASLGPAWKRQHRKHRVPPPHLRSEDRAQPPWAEGISRHLSLAMPRTGGRWHLTSEAPGSAASRTSTAVWPGTWPGGPLLS